MKDFIKNKKPLILVAIAIVLSIVLILIFSGNKIEGNWQVANINDFYDYSHSIYRVDLPYQLELFSDGTGLITHETYSTPDYITWNAEKGRLRINGEVFDYKVRFGRLVLTYQDDGRSDTLTYKKN